MGRTALYYALWTVVSCSSAAQDNDLEPVDSAPTAKTPHSRIGFTKHEEHEFGHRLVAHDMAFGDLDGDGDEDLIILLRRSDRVQVGRLIGEPTVKVYWNDSTEPFFKDSVLLEPPEPRRLFQEGRFPPLTDATWRPSGVDLNDFDGDGDSDILMWGLGEGRGPDQLRLYRSEGRHAVRIDDGTLHAQYSGWIGANAFVVAGDEPDVIELRRADGTAMTLRVPEAERWRFTVVKSCAWADFDGDGFLDVASNPRVFETDCLRLFRGTADGQLVDVSAERLPEPVRRREGSACAWVDLDADGDLDLVAANYGSPWNGGDAEVMLRNDGDGQFTWIEGALGKEPPRRQIVDLVVEDFDLDGDADVLFLGVISTCSYIAENLGDFRFRIVDLCNQDASHPHINGWSLDAADVDGDGDIDLVARGTIYLNTINTGSPK